jgi:hypothetical protein
MAAADPLVCPACARTHPRSERFCEACGMPLVNRARGEAEPTERQERARKIEPQYTEGPLVVVARAREFVQAEIIVALLLDGGIPSTVRAGRAELDGSQEILVAESAAEAAREALTWQRPPAQP